MLRLLAAVVTLAAFAASVVVAWAPVTVGEDLLRERLGAVEYVGWSATGLHLLYTALVTMLVLVLVLWPINRVLARMKLATRHRLEIVGQCLAVVLMLWMLLLPAYVWRIVGVVNALWDTGPPQTETWRFITLVQHHRGRVHADFTGADDPSEELSLFTIRPRRTPNRARSSRSIATAARSAWRTSRRVGRVAHHVRRTRLLHEPDVTRPHRPLDAGRARPALPHRGPRLRHDHEGPRVPRRQPDGQGARRPPRRRHRHRSRCDLRLPGRRLPRRRPRAAADRPPARDLLPLAVLRRGPGRGRRHQQDARHRADRRAAPLRRLRLARGGPKQPRARRHRPRVHRRRPLHRRRCLLRLAHGLGHALRLLRGPPGLPGLHQPPHEPPRRRASERRSTTP